jgi:uncharacterized low-complexity protein
MRCHGLFLSLLATLVLASAAARAEDSQYFGRWTVSDDKPVFSAKGKLYKTFDVAPCGKDFCGISVSDKGSCGETLFRFLTIHAKDEELSGHGRWGATKKKLVVGLNTPQDEPKYVYLGLGNDDMDIGGRDGSMPTFQANYKRMGNAVCKTS